MRITLARVKFSNFILLLAKVILNCTRLYAHLTQLYENRVRIARFHAVYKNRLFFFNVRICFRTCTLFSRTKVFFHYHEPFNGQRTDIASLKFVEFRLKLAVERTLLNPKRTRYSAEKIL